MFALLSDSIIPKTGSWPLIWRLISSLLLIASFNSSSAFARDSRTDCKFTKYPCPMAGTSAAFFRLNFSNRSSASRSFC